MKRFIVLVAVIAISTATIGCGKTDSKKSGSKASSAAKSDSKKS